MQCTRHRKQQITWLYSIACLDYKVRAKEQRQKKKDREKGNGMRFLLFSLNWKTVDGTAISAQNLLLEQKEIGVKMAMVEKKKLPDNKCA